MKHTLEIVNLSLEDTKIINESNADRSELCGDISAGGLTPTRKLIEEVIKITNKPISVIVRPNANNFTVSETEYKQMIDDIKFIKECGHNAVVFSVMTETNLIDINRNKELIELAKPMKSVFCKGFDYLDDKYNSIDIIHSLGFKGILTQGGLGSINDNLEIFNSILKHDLITSKEIEIIVAGGVGLENIIKLKEKSFTTLHAGNLLRIDNTYNTNLDINKINELIKIWNK